MSTAQPGTKTISGLLGARISSAANLRMASVQIVRRKAAANLKKAIIRARVTAKEGVGKGGLPRPGGSDDHNPRVGQLGHERPLTECGERKRG